MTLVSHLAKNGYTLKDFYDFSRKYNLKATLLSCHSASWLGKLLTLLGMKNLGAGGVILRLTDATNDKEETGGR